MPGFGSDRDENPTMQRVQKGRSRHAAVEIFSIVLRHRARFVHAGESCFSILCAIQAAELGAHVRDESASQARCRMQTVDEVDFRRYASDCWCVTASVSVRAGRGAVKSFSSPGAIRL